jgi:hypothetical protein
MPCEVLEELLCLNERLGRLMQAPDPALRPASDGPQDTVVEAEPSEVWGLRPADGLAALARRATRLEDATSEPDPTRPMPPGLRLWRPSDVALRLSVQARHDIESLYLAETARGIGARLPADNNDFLAGTYTLFSTPVVRVLYVDALRVFSPIYRSLARLCEEYARMVSRLYGLSLAEFRETAHLSIARAQPGRGVALAVLASASHMRGPVATITLGPVACLWDALGPSPDPSVRLALTECTLATVDGRARALYQFGEPEASCAHAPRYRITFTLSSRNALVADRCGPVLLTPIRAEGVVVTRALPEACGCRPVLDTPVLRALYDMHARLLVCESRLCMGRHERSFSDAHRR